MKKLSIVCGLLLVSPFVSAQSSNDIDLIQSLWGMEKQAIVEEYMDLSPEEATPFWTEYEIYEAARKELGRERIAIISEYVDNYESLSAEKATELMNAAIANNIASQKLAKKTFKNLSKSISPVKAAQFIQLENYLTLSIQLYVQDSLPFIGELEDLMEE